MPRSLCLKLKTLEVYHGKARGSQENILSNPYFPYRQFYTTFFCWSSEISKYLFCAPFWAFSKPFAWNNQIIKRVLLWECGRLWKISRRMLLLIMHFEGISEIRKTIVTQLNNSMQCTEMRSFLSRSRSISRQVKVNEESSGVSRIMRFLEC